MSTFAARMLEAQRTKQDARNRGQSCGDYRGLAPRTAAVAYRDMVATINAELDLLDAFRSDLHWIVAELNDATMADLAATF